VLVLSSLVPSYRCVTPAGVRPNLRTAHKVPFSSDTGGIVRGEVNRGLEVSVTQQKRLDKIERMRRYFDSEQPGIYEWDAQVDEAIDFNSMTDVEVANYLKRGA
jgi:hypothetical protein